MGRFVLDQAVLHKRLRAPKEGRWIVNANMPEMVIRDVVKLATALQQLSQGLTLAQSQKIVTAETAAKIFCVDRVETRHGHRRRCGAGGPWRKRPSRRTTGRTITRR